MTNFNEEIIAPEIIGEKQKTGKDDIKVELITPDVISVPDERYGKSQNTLDANVAIRNLSTVKSPVMGTLTSPGGTGTQAVTGIGFTPSLIRFTAIYSATNGAVSWGTSTPTAEGAYYEYDFAGSRTIASTTACIYVRNSGGTSSSANVQSFDSDGFSLNWGAVGLSTNVRYECYL